jgi:hypothetical protein
MQGFTGFYDVDICQRVNIIEGIEEKVRVDLAL